ncbi:MAG: MucB/RseB C-terminal domain-containing protein [Gammaproteobacteria bacterium]
MSARARTTLVLVALICPVFAHASTETAQGWYKRMQEALATRSYEGIVVYMGDGQPGSYRLVVCADGYARLTALSGSAREIIRGPQVAVRMRPDGSSIVVHGLAGESSPLPFPPASKVDPARLVNYRLDLAGWDRVAGQMARVIMFTPRDQWRYGYRVWIAEKSGLPLRSELIADDGQVLEQAFFTQIKMLTAAAARSGIGAKTLELVSGKEQGASHESDGACPDERAGTLSVNGLPPGFRILQTVCEHATGARGPVTHFLVGDGLATISVFVAPYQHVGSVLIGGTTLGAVHAVGRVAGGFAVTAMGDAPSITISQIARAVAVAGH